MRKKGALLVDIDILLATCNGEAYIHDQLNSIIRQTFTNWRLLVRDDCSIDETPTILEEYAAQDDRIRLISDNKGRLGSVRNFEELVLRSSADLLLFSDQDDVWFPYKILVLKTALEKVPDWKRTPVIVHGDAMLADERLNVLRTTFVGSRPCKTGLATMLCSGYVQGSNMLFNRMLVERAVPFPSGIHMHDYYLALVNEAFGVRRYVSRPLMYYRLHARNQMGAVLLRGIIHKLYRKLTITNENISDVRAFHEHFGASLNAGDRKLIDDFMKMVSPDVQVLQKLHLFLAHPFFPLIHRLRYALGMIMQRIVE